ncbi:leucine aminopeptidase 1-like protein [Tanacetum coccineum]
MHFLNISPKGVYILSKYLLRKGWTVNCYSGCWPWVETAQLDCDWKEIYRRDLTGLGFGPELEKNLKHPEVCTRVILAKEHVNATDNVVIHIVLAKEAEKIDVSYSDVMPARILDMEECVELKMCSYLGVAAASTNPPTFIHLCYNLEVSPSTPNWL